ncbi:MAG TPA: DinB family protein [Thermoguttaceae bacterium]|nr:DinB family protein [Thermoguttaceae bacterium]HUU85194.1 DinB family protein [Phycisphaerae bacterium]
MKDETLNSLRFHMRTLHELVGDLNDAQMVQQPAGVANHPAWTLGHIAYSFEGIGEEIGLEPWLPTEWVDRFGTGSTPTDDPGAYPTKQELLEVLADGERRVRERLASLDDAALGAPLPDEQHRDLFATMGCAVLHVLVGHTGAHLGQLVVWRRAMGLPPATLII